MTNTAKMLTLMARREAMYVQQKAARVRKLTHAQAAAEDMRRRLSELRSDRSATEGINSVAFLLSQHWYALQIEENVQLAARKSEYLEGELGRAQTDLAQSGHRKSLYTDRAHSQKLKDHELKNARQEASQISINRCHRSGD